MSTLERLPFLQVEPKLSHRTRFAPQSVLISCTKTPDDPSDSKTSSTHDHRAKTSRTATTTCSLSHMPSSDPAFPFRRMKLNAKNRIVHCMPQDPTTTKISLDSFPSSMATSTSPSSTILKTITTTKTKMKTITRKMKTKTLRPAADDDHQNDIFDIHDCVNDTVTHTSSKPIMYEILVQPQDHTSVIPTATPTKKKITSIRKDDKVEVIQRFPKKHLKPTMKRTPVISKHRPNIVTPNSIISRGHGTNIPTISSSSSSFRKKEDLDHLSLEDILVNAYVPGNKFLPQFCKTKTQVLSSTAHTTTAPRLSSSSFSITSPKHGSFPNKTKTLSTPPSLSSSTSSSQSSKIDYKSFQIPDDFISTLFDSNDKFLGFDGV